MLGVYLYDIPLFYYNFILIIVLIYNLIKFVELNPKNHYILRLVDIIFYDNIL